MCTRTSCMCVTPAACIMPVSCVDPHPDQMQEHAPARDIAASVSSSCYTIGPKCAGCHAPCQQAVTALDARSPSLLLGGAIISLFYMRSNRDATLLVETISIYPGSFTTGFFQNFYPGGHDLDYCRLCHNPRQTHTLGCCIQGTTRGPASACVRTAVWLLSLGLHHACFMCRSSSLIDAETRTCT
jgi:hypothetical protein